MLPSTARSDTPSSCAPTHRGEKRRREIAAVAERMFFEQGFADTTMQAIAARAGASKETLYRHFGSKEELFAELVADRAKLFLEDIDAKFEQLGSVGEVLGEFGCKMLDIMMTPDAISLCRTVIAESPRTPALGEIFFSAGPGRVRQRLAEFLIAAHERGELVCRDPQRAAELFIGAVISTSHLKRLVLQDQGLLTRSEIRDHIDEVVALFMGRYAAAGAPGRKGA